jgi:hypothetical protein
VLVFALALLSVRTQRLGAVRQLRFISLRFRD